MVSSRTLVICDLDGTLVDAFGDIHAALNHALQAHGLPGHSIEAVRGFVGNGLSNLVKRAVEPGRHDLLAEVESALRAYYAKHPADHARLYDGVREAVSAIRAAGHATAILSNKTDALVQLVADRLNIRDLFDVIAGEQPGVALKPDPAAIHALLSQTGAKMAVMVGDGLPDAEAARNAGIGFVGVSWGLSPAGRLASYGPVASEASELPSLVDRAFQSA